MEPNGPAVPFVPSPSSRALRVHLVPNYHSAGDPLELTQGPLGVGVCFTAAALIQQTKKFVISCLKPNQAMHCNCNSPPPCIAQQTKPQCTKSVPYLSIDFFLNPQTLSM